MEYHHFVATIESEKSLFIFHAFKHTIFWILDLPYYEDSKRWPTTFITTTRNICIRRIFQPMAVWVDVKFFKILFYIFCQWHAPLPFNICTQDGVIWGWCIFFRTFSFSDRLIFPFLFSFSFFVDNVLFACFIVTQQNCMINFIGFFFFIVHLLRSSVDIVKSITCIRAIEQHHHDYRQLNKHRNKWSL